ncbi:hypothetical protein [Vibrio aerogenes]|uniref:hypothetical protein n=1 Tax=Vibrio aerogenes TaxID=92172 RepID=UPI001114B3DD|nr:hypothetical protein [Vibrio aerogenes]
MKVSFFVPTRELVPMLPRDVCPEDSGFCGLFGALISFVDPSGAWCTRPRYSFRDESVSRKSFWWELAGAVLFAIHGSENLKNLPDFSPDFVWFLIAVLLFYYGCFLSFPRSAVGMHTGLEVACCVTFARKILAFVEDLVRLLVLLTQVALGARAPDTLSGMKEYPENPFGGSWPERFCKCILHTKPEKSS